MPIDQRSVDVRRCFGRSRFGSPWAIENSGSNRSCVRASVISASESRTSPALAGSWIGSIVWPKISRSVVNNSSNVVRSPRAMLKRSAGDSRVRPRQANSPWRRR